MQKEFWLERWQNQKIGFHQNQINPYLLKHWSSLNIDEAARVFVPLCGKSSDLVWLRQQGYDVIGIEFSQHAVESFFNEQAINYELSVSGKLNVYKAEAITLYQGDFFDLEAADLGTVSAVFDRAALIALPEAMRADYCQHIMRVAGAAEILLISMEYDQEKMSGPPFSVTEQEILKHFSETAQVKKLETTDLLKSSAQFKDSGLQEMDEKVFKISLSRNINNNAK